MVAASFGKGIVHNRLFPNVEMYLPVPDVSCKRSSVSCKNVLGLCHTQYFVIAHFSEHETLMCSGHVFQYVPSIPWWSEHLTAIESEGKCNL